MPNNCVLINQQTEQTVAFLLGLIHAKQSDFERTIVFGRNPRSMKGLLTFFDLTSGHAPEFMLLRDL